MVRADFDFKEVERKIKDFWDKENIYKFDSSEKGKIYSIDTPPPTVSGKMHMGHALSYSQQDFIARFKKMKGFNVFYPFGTDDNGLATEKLIQKEKGIDLRHVSREEAVKICMEFLKEERPNFIQDWKDIGMSIDFELTYSTIDDYSRTISQKSFLELLKKGLAYRKEAPVIWDTEFQTAIAQAELEDKEKKSYFNDLIFKTSEGEDLIIGTTRPELLGACVAVFVNPKDKRYKNLVGKKAVVPLYNHEVEILEDEKVDMEKGTGIVMCCTFGDQTDIEWYKQYNLPLRMLINSDGTMNEKSGKYKGMKIEDARKKIIEDLKKENLLKNQKEITHVVQIGERGGKPVEIINSREWYIKYLDKKKDFLKASEKLNWYPKHMKTRLDNWIKGLNWDWSVSRQRHFGIPIPVWYCESCDEIIPAKEEQLPVDPVNDKPPANQCPKCKSDKIIPDKDVFDTWFTSGSSPFLAINLVDEKTRKKLFPMSLRPQGHDIINFWLFYTMAKTQLLYGKNPWEDVTIFGMVNLKGEKMSKSKGNVIEPQKIMEEHGSDAVRYWIASSRIGEDLEFSEKEILSGKKLIKKIINSANFVFMNLKDYKPKKTELLETDRLFLNHLNKLIENSTKSFDKYEFHRVKIDADTFFWKDFCDNYLEIVKNRVYNGSEKEKESAFYTLYYSFLSLMKLFAPIMPFITEEIYQNYFKDNGKGKSIHLSSWPEKFEIKGKKNDEEVFDLMVKIIEKVRQEKSKAKKSVKAEIVLSVPKDDKEKLKDVLDDLKSVTNAKEIKAGEFRVEFV